MEMMDKILEVATKINKESSELLDKIQNLKDQGVAGEELFELLIENSYIQGQIDLINHLIAN